MGKFTNPLLVAAGTALIVVGVAAQTGTVNLGTRGGSEHPAVTSQHPAAAAPKASPTPVAVARTQPSPPAAAPVAPAQGGGGDEGDGADGGD